MGGSSLWLGKGDLPSWGEKGKKGGNMFREKSLSLVRKKASTREEGKSRA